MMATIFVACLQRGSGGLECTMGAGSVVAAKNAGPGTG